MWNIYWNLLFISVCKALALYFSRNFFFKQKNKPIDTYNLLFVGMRDIIWGLFQTFHYISDPQNRKSERKDNFLMSRFLSANYMFTFIIQLDYIFRRALQAFKVELKLVRVTIKRIKLKLRHTCECIFYILKLLD